MRTEVIPQFALGGVTRQRVGDRLNHAIAAPSCDRFRFAVAYMRLSGLDRIGAAVDTLVNRGGTVSGAVGIDDEVTSEEALRSLQAVSGDSTVFHSISGFIFHPKLYIASGPNHAAIVIGSANLTRDGLYRNVEIATAIHLDLRLRGDQDIYRKYDAVISELLDTNHANVQPLTDVLINILVAAGKVRPEAQSPEPGPTLLSRRGQAGPVPPGLATLFPSISVPVAPPPLRRATAAPPLPTPARPVVGTAGTFLLQLSPFDSSHRSGVPGTPEVLIPHAAVPFFPTLTQGGRQYPDVFFDVVLNTHVGRAIHGYRLWYYEYRATGTRIDEYRLRMDRETIDLSTPGGSDLLIINRIVVSGATSSYEVTVLPQTDPTFPAFLARCTYIVQGKRWGLT